MTIPTTWTCARSPNERCTRPTIARWSSSSSRWTAWRCVPGGLTGWATSQSSPHVTVRSCAHQDYWSPLAAAEAFDGSAEEMHLEHVVAPVLGLPGYPAEVNMRRAARGQPGRDAGSQGGNSANNRSVILLRIVTRINSRT